MLKYKQIVIGIDQSYENTGISIVADGKIKDIKSINLSKYQCNTEKRGVLKVKLRHLLSAVSGKAENIVCIVERVRVHGNGMISVDVITAMGSLIALIVDVMYAYGVEVYSVDTRSWKSKVVGTSKPQENIFGVSAEKWPTIKWIIKQGFEEKILMDVTKSRKTKGIFVKNGKKYQYNDDAADSAGIAMFYFVGDKNKLKLEK